jgi:leucyl-tRNA synthetase
MSSPTRYNIRATEAKWRKAWDENKCFEVQVDKTKPKYYVLEMFPYPSGRIHMGHVRNYTLGDTVARYRKAQGFNVLHPMGWDAFGLPAENAAIENGAHPGKWTYENIDIMRTQMQSLGLAFDWSRELASCHPGYYKHEQKMFLDMLKKGLAYRKESVVNWDPVENTVLANEQVVDGKGWRSGVPVERRKLYQWFLKITDYAEDLLQGISQLPNWPDKIKLMQENWIGKSSGCRLRFQLNERDDQIEVYTTRPDTLFGAAFVALAPDHPLAVQLAGDKQGYAEFLKACEALGTSEAAIETAEKIGFDTGFTVAHPFDASIKLPVYLANFILMDYGTGAIFGCPAHDQRDLDFARKYKLPVRPVVIPEGEDTAAFDVGTEAYTGPGKLANSRFLDGLEVEAGKAAAIAKCEEMGIGQGVTQFRIRDWGVSRQRYWGCPIPIIHCEKCGTVPVPDNQLPVTLPEDVTFDAPGNPLARHPTWKNTTCPSCNGAATRETDTFDTFFESSWYFARFCDPRNEADAFSRESVDYWLPVDQYIGGAEHAVMHLLYARFFSRALSDCGYYNVDEPFTGLYNQGMVCHVTYKDQNGKWTFPKDVAKDDQGNYVLITDGSPVQLGRVQKMSKSKKNVVDPVEILESYGADAARLFVLSDSPPDRDLEWTEAGLDGAWRYLNRVYRLIVDNKPNLPPMGAAKPAAFGDAATALRRKTHQTLAFVAKDIEDFVMNKSVARIRELTNMMESFAVNDAADAWALREAMEALICCLGPMTPHIAEELWAELGGSAMLTDTLWLKHDPALLVADHVTVAVQVNGKLRATITLPKDVDQKIAETEALSQPGVQKALEGVQLRKVIVVPNRIVNVVAS